ncbi:toprim domain-containing protein [Vibrio cholerae]|nr:toprim domain-containing protein [Vibrio cholerae]
MNSDTYIQSCINGICNDIANCSTGERNSVLNKKAYRLFQAVGAGQVAEQLAVARLTEAAQEIGLTLQPVKDTLKSARRGIAAPKPFGNDEGIALTPEIRQRASAQQAEQDAQAQAKQLKSIEWLNDLKHNSAAGSPYLARKQLSDAHQLFFTGEDNKGAFTAHELFNKSGQSAGFERIYHDGSKMVSAGCGASGVYYGVFFSGQDDDSVCYVTEGAADAVSIMLSTGKDAYSATSATNIIKVAQLMQPEYQRVIIALDNDKAGLKVVEKLGDEFLCVIPEKEGADYSDVYCAGGVDEVNRQLTNKAKPDQPTDKATVLNLDQFAITNIEEMRSMLTNDNWVLDRLALMGQITIIFAKPNSGKTLLTLRMLIDSVKNGSVAGSDIYYLNSDDTLRGLTTKAELAAQYGIKMLASGYNGFKNSHLAVMLEQLTARDEAKGKVLILDTLKKFSDLMNKTESSAFNEIMRGFVSKGGTVIALAHTNKARDADGKVIFQGTSDTVDDADCCYTLDVVNSVDDSFRGTKLTTKTVLFENFKARGDNADKVSYQYTKIDGEPYSALLDSVKPVDEIEAMQAEKRGRIDKKLADHAEEIQLILDAIAAGTKTTEKIISYLMEEGISRARAKKVLKEHSGDDYHEGHRWRVERGEKNGRLYRALR